MVTEEFHLTYLCMPQWAESVVVNIQGQGQYPSATFASARKVTILATTVMVLATGGKQESSFIHPLKEQPSCAQHPGQPRNVYCNPCGKELCAECLIPEHLSHDVVVLPKKRQELEAKLEEGICQAVQRIAEIDLRDQELQQQQTEVGVRLQKDLQKLQDGKQEADRTLKAWYDSQLEALNRQLDTTSKRLKKEHDDRAKALKKNWGSNSKDVQNCSVNTRTEKQKLEKLLADARTMSPDTNMKDVLSTAADLDRAISCDLPTHLKLPASMGEAHFPLELSGVQSPDLATAHLDNVKGVQGVMPQNTLEIIETQKLFVGAHLSKNIKKGEAWYLVEAMWFKQWKRYVGYDSSNTFNAGKVSALPGLIDNAALFKNETEIRENMVEKQHYVLVPEPVWNYFVQLYGLASKRGVVKRFVIEQGAFVKHCKIEVYLPAVKMCLYGNPTDVRTQSVSRVTTIAQLEHKMRQLFGIESTRNVHLWDKQLTSGSFEQLAKPENTLQDHSFGSPQHALVIEKQNEDGTWPKRMQLRPGWY